MTETEFRAHLAAQGYGEAEEILRATLATQESTLPAGHSQIQVTKSYLGEGLAGLERYAEAEGFLQAADARYLELVGPDHEAARGTARALVSLYEAWGRPDEADRYRPRTEDTPSEG